MTDAISPVRTNSTVAPASDYAGPSSASAEQGPAGLMPEPLPQSSCTCDPAFAIGALYAQMLNNERSASRKNAVLDEARIQREADKQIDDMRKAADQRFAQSIVSGISKVGSGFLEAAPGVGELFGASVTENGKTLFQGSAHAAAGLGELLAGNYERDASGADRAAERHDANSEAATRRQLLDSDAGSDVKAQLERVFGYMQELEQARAQALSAAVLRA
jgi:hypothetical protein